MAPADIRRVINLWAEQVEDLGRTYRWVQVFENKGAVMGCSNPHPHGQVWATRHVPMYPLRRSSAQRRYFNEHGRDLLGDYLLAELDVVDRVVCANARWVRVFVVNNRITVQMDFGTGWQTVINDLLQFR